MLIRKPRVLFLDEPTAHFDIRSEGQFLDRLKNLAAGEMTIIVSTHRLSLLSLVERILLFDQGKLIADGPRDKVIALLRGQDTKNPKSATIAPVGEKVRASV
jgi:ATP-binding cassette subfamily C protein LapB